MAEPAYPTLIAFEVFGDGDSHATHNQLKLVAEHHAPRTREFAFEAALTMAKLHCQHQEQPNPLRVGLPLANRRVVANVHSGLCGVHLASVIAGLRFADIAATSRGRSVNVTYTVLGNQVCTSHLFQCAYAVCSLDACRKACILNLQCFKVHVA